MTDQTGNLALRDQLAWPLINQPQDRADGGLCLRAHQQARPEAS